MASSRKRTKRDEGIGFAGLTKLVSNVDLSQSLNSGSFEAEQTVEDSSFVSEWTPQTYQGQQRNNNNTLTKAPFFGTGMRRWTLGVGLSVSIIGLIFFGFYLTQVNSSTTAMTPLADDSSKVASASQTNTATNGTGASTPGAQSGNRSSNGNSSVAAIAPLQGSSASGVQTVSATLGPGLSHDLTDAKQTASRLPEDVPPVGQNLVLSISQIRYCLAEGIRIDGARVFVNVKSGSEVKRFDTLVTDFNSRCGRFRYASGAVEAAEKDVEPFRDQLLQEGAKKFNVLHTTKNADPMSGEFSKPAPNSNTFASVQNNIQRNDKKVMLD